MKFHVEEEDKMGRSNSPRPGLSLSSQFWAFFPRLIAFKMSLGKADNLEDKWDKKTSVFVFYCCRTDEHNLAA